ncbi:hypothetical protein B0H19DRAFT_1074843 [Mycena capillaripes]|nr:hypothetical protein B0H19DRAFT_1074843 [Mycena capillaripes]
MNWSQYYRPYFKRYRVVPQGLRTRHWTDDRGSKSTVRISSSAGVSHSLGQSIINAIDTDAGGHPAFFDNVLKCLETHCRRIRPHVRDRHTRAKEKVKTRGTAAPEFPTIADEEEEEAEVLPDVLPTDFKLGKNVLNVMSFIVFFKLPITRNQRRPRTQARADPMSGIRAGSLSTFSQNLFTLNLSTPRNESASGPRKRRDHRQVRPFDHFPSPSSRLNLDAHHAEVPKYYGNAFKIHESLALSTSPAPDLACFLQVVVLWRHASPLTSVT